jgi:hypothetical protein
MATEGWWRRPELHAIFEDLGKARSNRSSDVEALLREHGVEWSGMSGSPAYRTFQQLVRRERSGMFVREVHVSDGRLAVIESDGTVLITRKPVSELSAQEWCQFEPTSLFNSTSHLFWKLGQDIMDRGLEGVGLYANGTYYVVPPVDGLAGNVTPDRRDSNPDVMAFENGSMRRAFSGFRDGDLARDLENLPAIRKAMTDQNLQFRMYTAPVMPPDGPPGPGD